MSFSGLSSCLPVIDKHNMKGQDTNAGFYCPVRQCHRVTCIQLSLPVLLMSHSYKAGDQNTDKKPFVLVHIY